MVDVVGGPFEGHFEHAEAESELNGLQDQAGLQQLHDPRVANLESAGAFAIKV